MPISELACQIRFTVLLVSIFFSTGVLDAAGAMPASRHDDGSAQPIRSDSFLGTSDTRASDGNSLVAPYEDLFDHVIDGDRAQTFFRVDGDDGIVALTPEERDELKDLLQTPETMPFGAPEETAFGQSAGPGAPVDRPEGPLLQQFVDEVDALYAEIAASADSTLEQPPDLSSFPGRTLGPTTTSVRVVRSRSGDDLPLLSAIPLGTLFADSIKSLVESSDTNRSTIASLRNFVLVSQPDTGVLMMVDSGSGYTLMVHTPENPSLFSGEKVRDRYQSLPRFESPSAPTDAGNSTVMSRPLHLKIWDLLTTPAAFVFYGVALICWAAWRYVISRYA
ncbi:MAG: hypothetical protein D6763_03590 [Alphaproteobacteria bacterium]|nr:MAG: hypothetical protein D6763_03590 [Alphaproteobacteria bacterium]